MARHTGRPRRGPAADSPAGRALGLDDRDIPGGEIHVINPQTRATPPALAPEPQLFADGSLLDHGVPDERPGGFETPDAGTGPAPRPAPEPEISDSVPVYIVPGPYKGELAVSSPRQIPVPASGNTPVRVCGGADRRRVGVLLLNESATIIRIGGTEVDAANGGAALPASMTNYLWIGTQGSLYAVADSGSSVLFLSVIEEFAGAGR